MRGNTGILLIAVGLIALYIVLSDKYVCFVNFAECLTGADMRTPEGYTRSDSPTVDSVTPPFAGSGAYGSPTLGDIWGLLRKVTK